MIRNSGFEKCIDIVENRINELKENGIPDDKLNELSEDERYLVIGIEDGWIHADRKTLSEYHKIYDRVMKED